MYGKIFKISKTPTQSGLKHTHWKLTLESKHTSFIENSTGWTSNSDTNEQLQLTFSSKEAAIDYAVKNNIEYELSTPSEKKIKPKAYADNFITKK